VDPVVRPHYTRAGESASGDRGHRLVEPGIFRQRRVLSRARGQLSVFDPAEMIQRHLKRPAETVMTMMTFETKGPLGRAESSTSTIGCRHRDSMRRWKTRLELLQMRRLHHRKRRR